MHLSQVIEMIYAYYNTPEADDNRWGEGIRLNFYMYGVYDHTECTIRALEYIQDAILSGNDTFNLLYAW